MSIFGAFDEEFKKTALQRKEENRANQLFTAHPEGTFDCTVIEVLEPKRSLANQTLFYIQIKVKTDKGYVFITQSGYAQAIMTIWRMREILLGTTNKVKVRHRWRDLYKNNEEVLFLEVDFMDRFYARQSK